MFKNKIENKIEQNLCRR